MEITFKIAERGDIDLLITFIQGFYEYDHHPYDEDRVQPTLARLLEDKNLGGVWLIQADNENIGYIILTWGYSLEYYGRDAFIDELYIRESYRGQGIGLKAIAFAEETARSFGVNALHLEVERENSKAQSFYRKTGFEDQDSYLMTKWISR
jgi:diamine N-acetyltransferase